MFELIFAAQVAFSELEVVDGDTIDRGEVRYRVLGLDAPEIQSARCLAERRLGLLAREAARTALRQARSIELVETGVVQPATDRYRERREARVLVDGVDLGVLLITAGYAQAWEGRVGWCNGR